MKRPKVKCYPKYVLVKIIYTMNLSITMLALEKKLLDLDCFLNSIKKLASYLSFVIKIGHFLKLEKKNNN